MSDWDDGHEPPRPSIGQLVEKLTEQTTRLVRSEIALVKAELTTKLTHAGIAIGLFVVAGVLALYALGWLLYAAFAGLAEAFAPWLAALILGVALLVVIAIMALVGKAQLKRGMPPTPEAAMQSIKDDIATLKGGTSASATPTASAKASAKPASSASTAKPTPGTASTGTTSTTSASNPGEKTA
ncbi:putative superfamily III holin-X [Sediminihabitans luteus]|uniref:Putative superfamily III holin-X n=1 Tax=Sediminihabitans luteus TaxID=1138585 RepID=A0A2M9D092_9CELL|nr:phage holin family protein [Sediminihabitans luteus]PJJ77601.1 putative superfamily III holin-X [Sediminihabitans luteus]GII98501.1 hypothetical protein Slu03_08790 [Sediminihabitans luteus]